MITKANIFILLFLLLASHLEAQTIVSQDLVGHWSGVSGSARIDKSAIIGAGFAKKDIGHRIESFEFDIASDGLITGHGVALYWFNVSAAIPKGQDGLFLSSSATNDQLEMTVEWKAKKDEGKLIIYDINTPGPDNSFISTDGIGFRAKVKWAEHLNGLILWKSKDAKEDNIDSGQLSPAEVINNPDYSAKPNPPAAPNGRRSKLSYRDWR